MNNDIIFDRCSIQKTTTTNDTKTIKLPNNIKSNNNNNNHITTIITITILLRQLLLSYYFCCSCCCCCSSSSCFGLPTIKPLPKHHINKLKTNEFDSIYWDKRPVILSGATACPHVDFNLSDIPFCYKNSAVSGKYVHTKFRRTKAAAAAADDNDNTRVHKNKNVKKEQPSPPWAGLKPGNSSTLVAINEFVHSMLDTTRDNNHKNNTSSTTRRQQQQRFMFDVPMVEICPTHLNDVRLPPHFINRFASQFQWRRNNNNNNENDNFDDVIPCDTIPFFNIYLSDTGFETDLHIDAGHAAFIASMCAGRKLWRVMTPEMFASVHHLIGGGGGGEGRLVNETWVMSDVRRPFDTWTDNVNDDDGDDGDGDILLSLRSLNESVVVYEGVLEPGEILYIPPGAPHAAKTLDPSWMVASNDRSIRSMRDVVGYCDLVRRQQRTDDGNNVEKEGPFCRSFRRRWDTVWDNFRQYSSNSATTDDKEETTTTEMTSFAETFHCEESFAMLTQSRLEITHDNLFDEVYHDDDDREGDDHDRDHDHDGILVMKYFKGCIHCLVFLKQVLGTTTTTTSNGGGGGGDMGKQQQQRQQCNIRMGFVSCPDGECLNLPHEKNNDEYQKMVRLVRQSSPEFVFVTPRSSSIKTTASTLRKNNDETHRHWRVVRGGGGGGGGGMATTTTANDDEGDDRAAQQQRRGISVWHYYGPMNVNILRVWIGMKTKCHIPATDDDDDDGPSVCWTFVVICYLFYLEFIAIILERGMGISPTANDVMVVSIISLVVFLIGLVGMGINCCFASCKRIYLKDSKRKSE